MVLVGNKLDLNGHVIFSFVSLNHQRQVSSAEGAELARKWDVPFLETRFARCCGIDSGAQNGGPIFNGCSNMQVQDEELYLKWKFMNGLCICMKRTDPGTTSSVLSNVSREDCTFILLESFHIFKEVFPEIEKMYLLATHLQTQKLYFARLAFTLSIPIPRRHFGWRSCATLVADMTAHIKQILWLWFPKICTFVLVDTFLYKWMNYNS